MASAETIVAAESLHTGERPAQSGSLILWALPILLRQRRTILRATILGAVLSLLAAFLIPARYESTVRIMPPDARPKTGPAMLATALSGTPVAAMASGGLSGLVSSRSPNALFLSVLGSRTAQDDLINRFDLRRVYGRKLYLDARKLLARRTSLSEDRKTGVVTLTVTASTPRMAHNVAAAYVDELNKLVVQMDTSSAHQERVFLESRLKEVSQDLDAASARLSAFSSRNATVDVQGQAAVTLNATARLHGELIATESELNGLQAIYTQNHPRVREAQARVASLRRELADLDGSSRTDANDADPSRPYPSLRELPILGATYAQLYSRVKIEQTVFEVLTRQYELAKVEEAEELPAVKVLDPPDYPEKKSFPPRTLIALMGTLLALLGACGGILVRDAWRHLDAMEPVRTGLHDLLLVFTRTDRNVA